MDTVDRALALRRKANKTKKQFDAEFKEAIDAFYALRVEEMNEYFRRGFEIADREATEKKMKGETNGN